MRLLFCWTRLSGYMAACWRALAQTANVEISVIVAAPQETFGDALLAGIPHQAVDWDLLLAGRLEPEIRAHVGAFQPDVIFLPGWFVRSYRSLVTKPVAPPSRLVMTLDNPWRGSVRQRVGAALIRRFVARHDALFVPGERAFQFAQKLGFPPGRIERGLYGCDYAGLQALWAERSESCDGWPRAFVFMGRYDNVKGIHQLVEAYRQYRSSAKDPWLLRMCGRGPLAQVLEGCPGVENLGFVQPAEQPAILRDSGVAVLASTHEPWGVILLESCAAGLPIICTDACGSAVELVRPFSNGLIVDTNNVAALTGAMRWMHDHTDQLAPMGRISRALAEPYSAQAWADRVIALSQRLLDSPAA